MDASAINENKGISIVKWGCQCNKWKHVEKYAKCGCQCNKWK